MSEKCKCNFCGAEVSARMTTDARGMLPKGDPRSDTLVVFGCGVRSTLQTQTEACRIRQLAHRDEQIADLWRFIDELTEAALLIDGLDRNKLRKKWGRA